MRNGRRPRPQGEHRSKNDAQADDRTERKTKRESETLVGCLLSSLSLRKLPINVRMLFVQVDEPLPGCFFPESLGLVGKVPLVLALAATVRLRLAWSRTGLPANGPHVPTSLSRRALRCRLFFKHGNPFAH